MAHLLLDRIAMTDWVALVGRVLLAGIFLVSGIVKIVEFGNVRDVMTAHFLPVSDVLASALILGSVLLEVLGALSLILGFRTKWGTALLVVALLPATFVFHVEMGDENQIVHFFKNFAILGGLLLVAAFGPGSIRLGEHRDS